MNVVTGSPSAAEVESIALQPSGVLGQVACSGPGSGEGQGQAQAGLSASSSHAFWQGTVCRWSSEGARAVGKQRKV